jgi:hypothetical protein
MKVSITKQVVEERDLDEVIRERDFLTMQLNDNIRSLQGQIDALNSIINEAQEKKGDSNDETGSIAVSR